MTDKPSLNTFPVVFFVRPSFKTHAVAVLVALIPKQMAIGTGLYWTELILISLQEFEGDCQHGSVGMTAYCHIGC